MCYFYQHLHDENVPRLQETDPLTCGSFPLLTWSLAPLSAHHFHARFHSHVPSPSPAFLVFSMPSPALPSTHPSFLTKALTPHSHFFLSCLPTPSQPTSFFSQDLPTSLSSPTLVFFLSYTHSVPLSVPSATHYSPFLRFPHPSLLTSLHPNLRTLLALKSCSLPVHYRRVIPSHLPLLSSGLKTWHIITCITY